MESHNETRKIGSLMQKHYRLIMLCALCLTVFTGSAQNIQRFEYISSREGLSQNTVYSILIDRNGFMWIGTNNGLNRYDGKTFRIFKELTEHGEAHSNNRIEDIWQDKAGFIWAQSYDGYYHYFDQRTETVGTLPITESNGDETGDEATCFLQYSDSLVFVGSKLSGITKLRLDIKTGQYATKNFFPITVDNADVNITAMHVDNDKNLWIASSNGLALLTAKQIAEDDDKAKIFFNATTFTNAIAQVKDRITFGTASDGLLIYNSKTQSFDYANHENGTISSNSVKHVINTNYGKVIVTHYNGDIDILDETLRKIHKLTVHGKTVSKIYVDQYKQAWIACKELGITRLNLNNFSTRYYNLTPQSRVASVDLERPFFKEDNNNNLWIGTHGGGLAWYNRVEDKFVFYRNEIKDQYSIPSNIVHCIAEDHSGQIWIGTGQYLGGLVKVVTDNKALRTTIPNVNTEYQSDNVVRCLFEDSAHNLWASTKSGRIYIYNEIGKLIRTIDSYNCTNGKKYSSVAYSILIDRDGYLWISTKGCGVFVSQNKINFKNIEHEQIKFINFDNNQDTQEFGVNTLLGDNNAYSLVQDAYGNIWVATYGNGLSRIRRNANGVEINVFNTSNSNLSSNKARYVFIDKSNNLWVATTLGINKVDASLLNGNAINFKHYLHNDTQNSLAYNDVCYIYQSTENILYFGTIGGGFSQLEESGDSCKFSNISTANGLCNDAVYGIIEDNAGNLWISTENGISRKAKGSLSFETFNRNNGLISNSFSESACLRMSNGRLIFGGNIGFVTVLPLQLSASPYKGHLLLTGFQIANRNADIYTANTPLKSSITTAKEINLEYYQSSIGIEYRLLDFIDPNIVQYAYILEGLETEWNYVGNQTKAIYTNLNAGDYTFRVKCTYRNGEWSNSDTTITIHVKSPWWKTNTAFFFYFIIFLTVLSIVAHTILRINHYRHELNIEKRVNEIKLQFFTNVSHEIRTPLTLIIAPIEELLKQNLPQQTQKQMMIIRRNANRILMLVNQLLDFRKIQNNKMHLTIQKTNAIDVVQPVFDSFKLLAEHKHIACAMNIQPQIKPLWIDSKQIETVVYNLMSNALKFTQEGKRVNIDISQNEEYTNIAICDEGKGIDNNALPELFKRYTILSNNELSGTGIGLSLSYELVKLHHGELLVDSQLGQGSTFTIKLRNGRRHFDNDPMVNFSEENSTNPHAIISPIIEDEPTIESDNTNTKTALVVEDNPEILDYVCQSLQKQFRCLKATNGQEAIVIAKEQMPDIIISDLMMPVMDGTEMIKHLKNNFQTSHIPIIVLTAKISIDDEIDTLKLGVDAYIQKPFNTEHFITVVNNIMNQREHLFAKYCNSNNDPIEQKTDKVKEKQARPEAKVIKQIIDEQTTITDHVSVNVMSKDEEFIKNLVVFTQENYKSTISIDLIADSFNMSRTVFYNKVKSLTGQSPLEFVRQIKLKIAEELLQKGFNVSEVAFEIGYSDVKYFSKQFRAQFGYSPSQIKKVAKNAENNDDNID